MKLLVSQKYKNERTRILGCNFSKRFGNSLMYDTLFPTVGSSSVLSKTMQGDFPGTSLKVCTLNVTSYKSTRSSVAVAGRQSKTK